MDFHTASNDRAIAFEPDFARAFENRGLAYARLQQYRRAIADFDRGIELKADHARGFIDRGWANYYSGDRTSACRDWRRAAELGYR